MTKQRVAKQRKRKKDELGFTAADLAILDPTALPDESTPNPRDVTGISTLPRGPGLVGSGSIRAKGRHDFTRGPRGDAQYNQYQHQRHFEDATDAEIGDSFKPAAPTDEERREQAEVSKRQAMTERKRPKVKQYKKTHAAKWPARIALANAKDRLKTSKESLAKTQALIDALPALKAELADLKRSLTDLDRLTDVQRLVTLEGVRWKALRKSLEAIAKWTEAMPALEVKATEEAKRQAVA
ncbi:MAG TPA: hypothetical protein VGL34_03405 [Steroidobacteraceae bacterium]|jgi:hypothetical protein